ncbi:MAG: class I SAM-dependent methyltransferase [Brevibacterium aurantiacum]|uniref:Methyltransferase domain-containing protein n=1 Tax=Brevibacterium aurantiacum TaxID=273384 RepID=A0A2A3X9R1_BREAU|nr:MULTISPECIES: class I SAM-dependent methyltransferase [Brevibacterium]AZL14577.1 methyltransferase domain-containing protein [Brevibacterium aurantiacum]MDN5552433.1 class I SAM-dependent methyltransferase [Brevibacterium sp.]MDN5594035.1 class I SAM-dependent methyltransferase [Brevibacterium sp.]MDN5608602.1 class I SAM-dependent methyltransferase [Brevibacterium sp.]MDN5659744.1 class I SAM-dependent methyltransferase [Brevibacterium aurantiacum]
MSDFTWDPNTYLDVMAEEIPDYRRLQSELAAAVAEADPRTILDLGVGSGLTARRVAEALPQAHIHGIDESEEMLAGARKVLDHHRSTLSLGRLEDSLPNGPFDLVMSTLAVHHLGGEGKADLFSRIARVLVPGGRFVLADLVVPPDPADVITPIDGVIDTPSPLAEQLDWLSEAGLTPRVAWQHRDLAVVAADMVD